LETLEQVQLKHFGAFGDFGASILETLEQVQLKHFLTQTFWSKYKLVVWKTLKAIEL